jgi:hypothetical protein
VRVISSLALSAAILATVAATASAAVSIPRCTGSQLTGTLKAVPGSAGAGNIVYALVLTNRSAKVCTLTGLPQGTLLDAAGKPLPTHVVPAFRGGLTAPLVTLRHGKAARATARFSPDVPGQGEGSMGSCEPMSYAFRVKTPNGSTTKVKLSPPTPVCEHGQLQFSAYGPKT